MLILMSNSKANITYNKQSGDKFLVERAFFGSMQVVYNLQCNEHAGLHCFM